MECLYRWAVAQVNYSYNETLEELQTAESYDDVVMEGTGADWVDVLAIFAVKVAAAMRRMPQA